MKYLLFAFFLCFYLLFPNNNPGIDAYDYAWSIKYGEALFRPHHLLYNGFGWACFFLVKHFGWHFQALELMQAINSIFAALSLLLLWNLIQGLQEKISEDVTAGFVFFTGASYGVMRFATENETYIIPIFLSLAGSLYFLKHLGSGKNKHILGAGLFAAVACLFHQVHVFWWIGLFVGVYYSKGFGKSMWWYFLPALLVPLVYSLVLFAETDQLSVSSLNRYVFHEYSSGNVEPALTLKNVLLGIINLARTFIQLHGIQAYMFGKSWFYALPAIASLGLLVYSISKSRSTRKINPDNRTPIFSRSHLIIACLHVFFAFFAGGNSEFMVMLPYLFVLWMASTFTFSFTPVWLAGVALMVWNFTYGVFPSWKSKFSHHKEFIEFIKHEPEALFIVHDYPLLVNELEYMNGNKVSRNVSRSPSMLAAKGYGVDSLRSQVDLMLLKGNAVYTDIINAPKVLSRASIVQGDENGGFFAKYDTMPVDSFDTFYGYYYLHKMRLRE
ncbi:MAG: hypothetical protein M3Q97_05525 [Bacteroidota bacterium]|nr:hypothetical protein [Bacteroidota bacterium]